jgi:hypothetical protein
VILLSLASGCPPGCPSAQPLVTNAPYPWSCIPCWPERTVATFGPASPWWTSPVRVGGAVVCVVSVLVLVALAYQRRPGWLR